jgi:hypothetical protein
LSTAGPPATTGNFSFSISRGSVTTTCPADGLVVGAVSAIVTSLFSRAESVDRADSVDRWVVHEARKQASPMIAMRRMIRLQRMACDATTAPGYDLRQIMDQPHNPCLQANSTLQVRLKPRRGVQPSQPILPTPDVLIIVN